MAFMIDGKGPYPNRVGEYCGNYNPNEDTGLYQQTKEHRDWLAKMRFGRPHPSHKYSEKQMREMGMVGLYLTNDFSILPGAVIVPTPPELLEPTGPE